MANHIFTVNETTFKTHLNYMFAWTGSWTWDEWQEHQFWALTDILSLREWDNILFYVERYWFYWVFKVKKFDNDNCVFYEPLEDHKYADRLNRKILTYRVFMDVNDKIGVFRKWISEWNMIENPTNIKDLSIYNIQWSWVFKKLKWNRWCLSIPDDEFSSMVSILSQNNHKLQSGLNFDFDNGIIKPLNNPQIKYWDIKIEITYEKIYNSLQIIHQEIDLRKFFTSKIGNTDSNIFNIIINEDVNLILNEIKCSFWDKSMDLLISTKSNECYLIELKNNFEYNESIYGQLYWYSRWISSYKNYTKIFPILILRAPRDVTNRRWSQYFKYLSNANKENNITSDWYNEIITSINSWRNNLFKSWVDNLQELKVYLFDVDENNKITQFSILN